VRICLQSVKILSLVLQLGKSCIPNLSLRFVVIVVCLSFLTRVGCEVKCAAHSTIQFEA
jgi:hypothetical protein